MPYMDTMGYTNLYSSMVDVTRTFLVNNLRRLDFAPEAIFAFSPNPDSHAIILQHYGNFADVYVAMAEKNVENLHPKMKNFRYSICRPSPKPTFLVGE